MILKEYKNKVSYPALIDDLEKDSIIIMLFDKLSKAAIILFPNGIYKAIRWWQINRWVMLGKIMYDLIKVVMRRK